MGDVQMRGASRCWLCQCSSTDCSMVKTILDFVHECAMMMSEEEIVEQVYENILHQWPESDVTRENIRTHINDHMVSSNVISARNVRLLSSLADEVKDNVVTIEQETGHRCVDEKMAKLYLSFVNQIQGIMKAERKGFNTGKEKAAGAEKNETIS